MKFIQYIFYKKFHSEINIVIPYNFIVLGDNKMNIKLSKEYEGLFKTYQFDKFHKNNYFKELFENHTKKTGKSLNDIATEVGVSYRTLLDLKNGKITPSKNIFATLSQYLNIDKEGMVYGYYSSNCWLSPKNGVTENTLNYLCKLFSFEKCKFFTNYPKKENYLFDFAGYAFSSENKRYVVVEDWKKLLQEYMNLFISPNLSEKEYIKTISSPIQFYTNVIFYGYQNVMNSFPKARQISSFEYVLILDRNDIISHILEKRLSSARELVRSLSELFKIEIRFQTFGGLPQFNQVNYDDYYDILNLYINYCEPKSYYNQQRSRQFIESDNERKCLISAALKCIDKCTDIVSFFGIIFQPDILIPALEKVNDFNQLKPLIKENLLNCPLEDDMLAFTVKLILYILPTLEKNDCDEIIGSLNPFLKKVKEKIS